MKSWLKKISSKLPVKAGPRKGQPLPKLRLDGATCTNCQSVLYGKFCSVCGQRHHKGRNPYWDFMEDITDQMISPESKLWRTFVHLLFIPGLMTRNYFRGMRASYAPPIRLYLIALVSFFAALAILDVAVFKLSMVAQESVFSEEDKADALEDIEKRIQAARDQGLEERYISVLEGVKAEIQAREITSSDNFFAVQGDSFQYIPDLQMFTPLTEDTQEVDTDAINDFFELAAPSDEDGVIADFLRRVQNGFVRAAEDPRKLNNSLNIWLPRVMIVFVPMFGVFLRFFYWSKNHFILNQMVFSLHFHTALFFFLTFFLVAQSVFGKTAEDIGTFLATFGFPVFMYLSLKIAYEDGWIMSFVKFLVISAFYALGVSITLAGVFLLGLAEV